MNRRLAPIVVPVCLLGLGSVLLATWSFATTSHSASMLLGVAALLAASTLASRYPVPIEGPNSGGVSLSFVFAASAIVLFGWAAGVIVAFAAPVLIQLTEHRPLIRIGYNGSVFAGAAAVGGALVTFIHGDGTGVLISKVGVSASTQYGINLVLISLVVAVTSRRPFFELIRSSLRWTIIVFALMASAALDAGRPLAALAASVRGARRAPARDRALPALDLPRTPRDEARADRSADRARQPQAFSRPARARADRGRAKRVQLQPLPRRRRRLQARERPLRPPCRRPRPVPARDDAAPERRGVQARRRRVRAHAPRLRRERGREDRRRDRRADLAARPGARRLGDRLRRRRDLPAPGAGPRRADPPRGQRALLGQGERKESGARLSARRG